MNLNRKQIITASFLIILAATMKAITFPFSINPIIAISLFSGAVIRDRKLAFALPIFSMFFSDLMLEVFNIAPGFYGMGQIGNYASLLAIACLGFYMKKINFLTVPAFSIAGTLLFFVLSNTNVFLFDNLNTYGTGIQGWATCVAAGIPFVKNGLAIDLGFSVILFGGNALANKFYFKKVTA